MLKIGNKIRLNEEIKTSDLDHLKYIPSPNFFGFTSNEKGLMEKFIQIIQQMLKLT